MQPYQGACYAQIILAQYCDHDMLLLQVMIHVSVGIMVEALAGMQVTHWHIAAVLVLADDSF